MANRYTTSTKPKRLDCRCKPNSHIRAIKIKATKIKKGKRKVKNG